MRKTIICYGDSNTYGYDPQSFWGGPYPPDSCWVNIVKNKSGLDLQNFGACGREIPHNTSQIAFVCNQLGAWCKGTEKTEVWIMLGTNDLLANPGFTAEDAANRMEQLLRELQREASDLHLAVSFRLIAPVRMQAGTWTEDVRTIRESARLDEAYRALAARLAVDCTCAGAWDVPLSADGVHFTEEGHRIFAERLLRETGRNDFICSDDKSYKKD